MNGKHLTAKKLNDNHLQDVMALQKKIIDNLHPDERHFILQRSAEEFQQHLNGKSSGMLGVFDGDRLVAQMVYGLPRNGEKRDMPEFRPDIANDHLVIYEAVLVDPEYRGSSLMKRMLGFVEEQAAVHGRKHSLIQIAIDNPASWINALHHGMFITRVDRDPVDGAKVLYLEKTIASVAGLMSSMQTAALVSVIAVGSSLLFLMFERISCQLLCKRPLAACEDILGKLFDNISSEKFLLELLKETKIQNNSISNLITAMPDQFKVALNSGIASNLVPYLENLIFGINQMNKNIKEVARKSGGDDVDDLF